MVSANLHEASESTRASVVPPPATPSSPPTPKQDEGRSDREHEVRVGEEAERVDDDDQECREGERHERGPPAGRRSASAISRAAIQSTGVGTSAKLVPAER